MGRAWLERPGGGSRTPSRHAAVRSLSPVSAKAAGNAWTAAEAARVAYRGGLDAPPPSCGGVVLVRRRQHDLLAAGQRAPARVADEVAVVAQNRVGIGVARDQPGVHQPAAVLRGAGAERRVDRIGVLDHGCQSALKIDPLSACKTDPLGGTVEVVPVANRGDPRGFV